jgi:CYTH domain-containing protein
MKVNMDNEFEKDFLEVERKFAVKKDVNINYLEDSAVEILKIYQGYFIDEDGKYKRIRLQKSKIDGKEKSVVCEKIHVGSYNDVPLLKEIEDVHSYEYGVKLINTKNISCIEKTRYVLPIGDYLIEVDKFENLTDEFKDWVAAEVEFKNETELLNFNKVKLPDFILRECTGDKKYSNANMSKYIDKSIVHPFEKKAKYKM